MIEIKKNTIIYILCLPKIKTGGTELLHQLVYELNIQGKNAIITYSEKKSDPMPLEFEKYGEKYIFYDHIENNENNVLIIPEVMIYKIGEFTNIRKVIWWLSVDNFINRNGYFEQARNEGCIKAFYHLLKKQIKPYIDVRKIQKTIVENWVQSYYAEDFLRKKEVQKIEYLSDYLNEVYLSDKNKNIIKKNIVLYNPKKGYEFTKKLIQNSPEYNWVAIENMTTEQVRELLLTSKVYVDFGNHPGKDRFPREAAISGCCIITGKRGSAKFKEDIPIPEKYKFEDIKKNIPLILKQIDICLKNYNNQINDFLIYREYILTEKSKFIEDINKNIKTV